MNKDFKFNLIWTYLVPFKNLSFLKYMLSLILKLEYVLFLCFKYKGGSWGSSTWKGVHTFVPYDLWADNHLSTEGARSWCPLLRICWHVGWYSLPPSIAILPVWPNTGTVLWLIPSRVKAFGWGSCLHRFCVAKRSHLSLTMVFQMYLILHTFCLSKNGYFLWSLGLFSYRRDTLCLVCALCVCVFGKLFSLNIISQM